MKLIGKIHNYIFKLLIIISMIKYIPIKIIIYTIWRILEKMEIIYKLKKIIENFWVKSEEQIIISEKKWNYTERK